MPFVRIVSVVLFASLLQAQSRSTLIAGAQMADGSGAPLVRADVRIEADRIVAIGKLTPLRGETVIQAGGLVLAPGFIDVHNHSQDLTKEPGAASQVAQGITTVLLGQDGGSPYPLSDYLAQRRQYPAALNLQSMVGHATIRKRVMGDDFRREATDAEIAQMVQQVEEQMDQGAVGLSSGLEYEVGSYSSTAEVIAMARAAAKHNGIYVSHIRDEADLSMKSIQEAIRIGEEAKIPIEISHIKLGTASVWGKAQQVVALINAARARGVDVTADCYPYDAWASTITVLVPDKQYDNPASVKKALDDVGGGANITITHCVKHPDYEMHSLDEIAKRNQTDPVSLYMQIVKDGGAGVVCHAMKDSDIRTFYQTPWVMVGSDGGIGMRHPRGSGTYPRVLGLYVRQNQWLSLPVAIRKMTALPAERLKLKDRGMIRKGYFADLVLLNPATVIDRSSFAEPFLLPTGIEKVFVNGSMVWETGKTTGQLPGRVL